jgi:predicted phage baseplate assembly protein
VSEPVVRLDPRHYQDLVDEARLRVGHRCPEWTDHNVSDPGMTLIDQFAWMFDILLYRVNRLPDKIHEALLALLGVQLQAPVAARANVRFRLAKPPTQPLLISAGSAREDTPGSRPQPPVEVATVPEDGRPAIVFEVREDATVPVIDVAAAVLSRAERPAGQRLSPVNVTDGRAQLGPQETDRYIFSTPPRPDDALYLGFVQPIANLVLQVHVQAIPARGTSIDPDEAPLIWEVGHADGSWEPAEEEDAVEVLADTAGGFNYATGVVELQIPSESARTEVAGALRYWLRCRPKKIRADSEEAERAFTNSPQVVEIRVNAIGVLVPTHHAMLIEREALGVSDGTPGQTFRLLHAPALALGEGETVEVEVRRIERGDAIRDDGLSGGRLGDEDWEAWEPKDTLAESGHDDNHFLFSPATGEVQFGVAIKLRSYDEFLVDTSSWHQHGAIPPAGTRLRMSRYRHGGGAAGNVEAGKLSVLRTPIPGVASVTNPKPARGGLDGEALEEAQHRAADELRMRRRAVTREDFEVIAVDSSTRIARARCIPSEGDVRKPDSRRRDERTTRSGSREDRRDLWPRPAVTVSVLPTVDDPNGYIPPGELFARKGLRDAVATRLEEWCLVGTSAHVTPVALREVTVAVEVQIATWARGAAIEERILAALYRYLNPFVGGHPGGGRGVGWEWGRALDVSQLRLLVDRVDGVDDVLMLRAFETNVPTPSSGDRPYREIAGRLDIGPHELIVSGRHEARAIHGVKR